MSHSAIVLAAGKGTRMRSLMPKVLHPCGGQPLIAHVVENALSCGCDPVVVVLPKDGQAIQDALTKRFEGTSLLFTVQDPPAGTGDAVQVGLNALGDKATHTFILCGDVPLLRKETLAALAEKSRGCQFAVLTTQFENPAGYGRVICSGDNVERIVEEKDATKNEREIKEVNSGTYYVECAALHNALKSLNTNNAQGELYFTDCVEAIAKTGSVKKLCLEDSHEVMGINNRAQLSKAESIYRDRRVAEFQALGVSFLAPEQVWIEAGVEIENDVTIGPGVQLQGKTKIHSGAKIDGPTVIQNSEIGREVHIKSFSHLEGAQIGLKAQVGPFARLRPGAKLEEDVHVGNFVEIKNSILHQKVKAGHLAYLGDADIGEDSNIGAGTITCNYDGLKKTRTLMGPRTFIGSNATLVAPLNLGADSYIGAGSTITEDVESGALALGRCRQANKQDYVVKLRKILREDA